MLIDSHHHLWNLKAVHYPWLMARGEKRFFGDPASIQRDYLIEEFKRTAGANGVGASVHIQVGAEDGNLEAQWIDQVAREETDWPLVQVAFCDLTSTRREAMLDQLQKLQSLRGVRQIIGRAPGEDAQSGTNLLLKDPEFLKGLKSLAERGLSFDLQLLPELMAETAKVLADVPGLRVALCHAGSPYDRSAEGLAAWSESLNHLATLPNLCLKLSGLGMFDHQWTEAGIAPIVDTCLKQFGAERLMFGSNFPVDSLTSTYAGLVNAYRKLVPTQDHEQVFAGTAQRFYRLQMA